MHFFIVPCQNCNSSCSYCYNAKSDNGFMSKETLKGAVAFINRITTEQQKTKTDITFHGGEPLLPGIGFYRFALPYLHENIASEVKPGIQSNLWLLDQNFCSLFRQYNVSIGTSLDGPQEINDVQRCNGYFEKTMQGIQLAREHNLSGGCIGMLRG